MTERYNSASLPAVETVDMKEEMREGNTSVISRRLLELLEKNLQNNKQSILLLNRRGYNTYISCKKLRKGADLRQLQHLHVPITGQTAALSATIAAPQSHFPNGVPNAAASL